tara:strand:- start:6674 stop:6919 length:246 start_codon:yes stop_codon:yes gene_type:complete
MKTKRRIIEGLEADMIMLDKLNQKGLLEGWRTQLETIEEQTRGLLDLVLEDLKYEAEEDVSTGINSVWTREELNTLEEHLL